MKFGQLIEYSMRNIFLEKRYKNVVGKLVPDSFIKNHCISSLKRYTVFLLYVQVEVYQNILKLRS